MNQEAKLREALESVQWSRDNGEDEVGCPLCCAYRYEGKHRPTCRIGLALSTPCAESEDMSEEVEDALTETDECLEQGVAIGDDVARILAAEVRRLQSQSSVEGELRKALAEVVALSDRKHDAWDKAHALLEKP